jgi:DNA-binding CsgD family transcriptional regulator
VPLLRRRGVRLERVQTSEGTLFLVTQFPIAGPVQRANECARRWGLTDRESQVLAELVLGRSNEEIGVSLGCSVRTIEAHATSLFRKARVF